eukprot:TRINITY_DN23447_c0_g1_i1.p1 TRINITY_DN23447_c0_g1~~TRINITY_DN23447_c0_g1_i1.p1  ORF type:complete len:739 (-),score=97.65 TRINITY_DN23447_c0_g1_i1:183-2399(-)
MPPARRDELRSRSDDPTAQAANITLSRLRCLYESLVKSISGGACGLVVVVAKMSFPTSVAIIVLRQWRRRTLGRLRGFTDVIRLWLRHSLRLWVTVEAYFFIWYRYQKWRLSRVDIHVPPVRHKDGHSRAKRRELMERVLVVLDEVCVLVDMRESADLAKPGERVHQPRIGHMRRMRRPLGGAGGDNSGSFTRTPLRQQAADETPSVGLAPAAVASYASVSSADALLQRVSSWNRGVLPSAEDLVRLTDSQLDFNVESEVLHLSLKRAEICSWFFFAPIQDITRGNLAEWIAEYFFRGMSVEAIGREPELAAELWELVDRMVCWAHLRPGLPKEPNLRVRCMRLTRDPLPSEHRPFWSYLVTSLLVPRIIRAKLVARGFRHCRAGAMAYWLRQGERTRGGEHARSAPFIFCHGLGVGVLPYVEFVSELCHLRPDADVFCVDLPFIQLKPREEVPSARETCACIVDMLEAWGHGAANFVGHSFGTIVCAWAVRYMPEVVRTVSLIDPVCFLVCKSDLVYNTMYARRNPLDDLSAWLLSYLIFKELFVCHTLVRNMFWQQNQLWPDDVNVPCLVVLSGRDKLVPAHCIRRHLHIEIERRWLLRESKKSGGHMVIQTAPPCTMVDHATKVSVRSPGTCVGSALLSNDSIGSGYRNSSGGKDRAVSGGHHKWSVISGGHDCAEDVSLIAGNTAVAGAGASETSCEDELPPLRVRFFPDAEHGEFWCDRYLLGEVVSEIDAFV